MKVLGLDTGLANMGWAVVEYVDGERRLVDGGVISTKPSDKKRRVLASDDNMRRIQEAALALAPVFDRHRIVFAAIEAQSWPRSSESSAKIGMSWGIAGALLAVHRIANAQAAPMDIKKAVAGNGSASKTDVQAGVAKLVSGAGEALADLPKTRREHLADAIGAVVACEASDVFVALRAVA